ncbi:50S ribosomal protein L40e [Candidatus Woesearchaeota archaeon]|nr:50S ribosomal protein L40e [Candidatus Woesearchaeota archaeon]
MAKFVEADARTFKNVFVCRSCKKKIRGPTLKVMSGKIKCRKCAGKVLRPKKKK